MQSKSHLKVVALPKSSLSLIPSQPLLQAVPAKDCHSAYSHCSHRLPVLPLCATVAREACFKNPSVLSAQVLASACAIDHHRQQPMPFFLLLCRTWAHAPPKSTLQLGLLSARLLSLCCLQIHTALRRAVLLPAPLTTYYTHHAVR